MTSLLCTCSNPSQTWTPSSMFAQPWTPWSHGRQSRRIKLFNSIFSRYKTHGLIRNMVSHSLGFWISELPIAFPIVHGCWQYLNCSVLPDNIIWLPNEGHRRNNMAFKFSKQSRCLAHAATSGKRRQNAFLPSIQADKRRRNAFLPSIQ